MLTGLMEPRDDRKKRSLGVHTLMGHNRHISADLFSVYSADLMSLNFQTGLSFQKCRDLV